MTVKFRSLAGYVLAGIFAVVGAVFLLLPARLLGFFNGLSLALGMERVPETEPGFFLVLAAAYMAVVTALAWRIAKRPEEKIYPQLLAFSKIVSSVLSLGFFAFHAPSLIYLANGVVDGLLGLFALVLVKSIRNPRQSST